MFNGGSFSLGRGQGRETDDSELHSHVNALNASEPYS